MKGNEKMTNEELIDRLEEIEFNLKAQYECQKAMLELRPKDDLEAFEHMRIMNQLLIEQNTLRQEEIDILKYFLAGFVGEE